MNQQTLGLGLAQAPPAPRVLPALLALLASLWWNVGCLHHHNSTVPGGIEAFQVCQEPQGPRERREQLVYLVHQAHHRIPTS